MKKILIVHPEGSINNNSFLTGCVEILCEEGYAVTMYSILNDAIAQKSPCQNCDIILAHRPHRVAVGDDMFIFRDRIVQGREGQLREDIRRDQACFDFIVGVDQGIKEAALMAHALQVPYALYSAEIYFEREVGAALKEPERRACQNITFAICQDAMRAGHLSRENQIPVQKIITIPSAGRGAKAHQKQYGLYDALKIPYHKKIALFAGSLGTWGMVDRLLKSTMHWPEDWVLVLNNRYGMTASVQKMLFDNKDKKNVYFTETYIEDPRDMGKLLHSVDIGIGFYKPQYGHVLTGDNIKYIGLASGKILTYLQHGLPVLMNDTGALSDIVGQNHLGDVVDDRFFSDAEYIHDVFERLSGQLSFFRKNALVYFEKHFDLNRNIAPLHYAIKGSLQKNNMNITDETFIALCQDMIRYPQTMFEYARWMSQHGKHKQAVRMMLQIVRQWPTQAELMDQIIQYGYLAPLEVYRLASRYKSWGKNAWSEKWFQCLVTLTDDAVLKGKIYFHLGDLAYQSQDEEKALQYFSKTLFYCPDHEKAKACLNDIRSLHLSTESSAAL